MDKRFANMFGLTEADAIALLDKPLDQLGEDDSRYTAAAQLAHCPSEAAIDALMRAVRNTDESLENRIARRKSVESLGWLKAQRALPEIQGCLQEEDRYTVEVAVWAIGEIGTESELILEAMTRVLERSGQLYRVVIQTLAKLGYAPAVDRIRPFTEDADESIKSAAIAAVCRLTGDREPLKGIVELLQSDNVNTRRACLQDLIDTQYIEAIPQIARCPVSIVFRLRAVRLLAEAGIQAGALDFATVQSHLETVLCDRPADLEFVHCYDRVPEIDFLIRDLYHTDFGRCYLASQTLLEHYADRAPEALLATYEAEAHNDYGGHYHVVKLLGWLQHAPAFDLLIEALQNTAPQFRKSRAAAAIALGELGDARAIPALKASLETKIWDLKYGALLALEKLGDISGHQTVANDDDWLVRERAAQVPVA